LNHSSKNNTPKFALLVITRYPFWAIPLAFLSMALFRIPLLWNKKFSFWRLMGSGKNGTFSIVPDLKQWAMLAVFDEKQATGISEIKDLKALISNIFGNFIASYISLGKGQSHAILLQPREGHGLWNGEEVFGTLSRSGSEWHGPMAVLTRATIRPSKARSFWKHVDSVAAQMATADGFVTSYGIGEWPLLKQATFSVWQSKEAMYQFAYKMPQHKDVVRKTHQQKWYSEDMFVRFRLLKVWNLPGLAAVVEASTTAKSE
jgi:hypothetical protein